jgi:hypothetical protein
MDLVLYPVLKSFIECGLSYLYLSKILFFSIKTAAK